MYSFFMATFTNPDLFLFSMAVVCGCAIHVCIGCGAVGRYGDRPGAAVYEWCWEVNALQECCVTPPRSCAAFLGNRFEECAAF